MTQVGGRVNALDTSPDGAIIAVHEFWGSNTHGVSLVDAVTGERRLLTRLESLGLGDVRFSPDGAWLIVGTFLVEVATGRYLRLDTGLSSGQAAWWHARSPSALMLLDARAPGDLVVMAFDLATGAAELIGPITVPGTEELQDHHAFVKGLDVSADGRHALRGTSFGVSRAAWDAGWTGDRVSLIDVETRRLDVLVSPSLDGEMALERDHTRFRWLHRPSGTPVVLAPQLREQLSPPANTLGAENSDYVAGNARDVIVYGLNTMLGDAPAASDPHRLRPEVLRSLEALARFQPDGEYMNELREWIDAVSVHLLPLCRAGRLSSDVADGWLKFCEGWERIKNPGRGSISWASDRYLPAPRQTSPQLAAQPEPVAHSERPGIMPRIGQALESVELELPVDELDSFRQATTRLRGGDEWPALTGIAYHGQRRTYYVVTERGLHYRHCARRAGLQAGRVIEPRKDDEHGAHRLDRQGLDQSSQDEVPQVQHGLLSQRQGRAGGRRLQEPELQRRAALPRLAQSLMPPLHQTP